MTTVWDVLAVAVVIGLAMALIAFPIARRLFVVAVGLSSRQEWDD